VVDLVGVDRRFDTQPPVDALVDVDFRVRRGEWVAVVGPSGSGKSTLLNVLGCLDRHTSGRYSFEGVDVGGLSDTERAGLRSERIGFVFQAFHLLAHRPVIENVMMAELYQADTKRGRRDRALDALESVGLGHRADFVPTRLSGGERQRVAVARALLGRPSLLLCDEPTGNLDSHMTEAVLELFTKVHRSGLTLVVITHEGDVARAADRQVRIVDGTIVEPA
jgi:macrolide transport system ATP-binding/permease protein